MAARVYSRPSHFWPPLNVGDPHVFLCGATPRQRGDEDRPKGGRQLSRDFIGALLQLNAEKGVPREQLVAHRRGRHPVAPTAASTPGNEDVYVEPRHRERRDARLSRHARRRIEVEDPTDRVHPRRGQEARARAPRSATSSKIERLDADPLRTHPRPDRDAGRAPAPARSRARAGLRPVRAARGEIITGTVSRVEPRGVILDMGKAEAILPTTDQSATRALPHRPARQGLRAGGPAHHAGR